MRRRGPVGVQRRGPGVVGTVARTAVIAGTATVASEATRSAMDRSRGSEATQPTMTPQQAAEYQAAAGPIPGSLEDQALQIQKLQVMKEQGLITEDEFQAKKKQVLGI